MMRSCCWRSWAPGHRLVGRFAWRQLQRQPADVGCRTDCGADRRSLVARRDKPGADPFPAPAEIDRGQLFSALSVMFWCFVGLEAFAHLASGLNIPSVISPGR